MTWDLNKIYHSSEFLYAIESYGVIGIIFPQNRFVRVHSRWFSGHKRLIFYHWWEKVFSIDWWKKLRKRIASEKVAVRIVEGMSNWSELPQMGQFRSLCRISIEWLPSLLPRSLQNWGSLAQLSFSSQSKLGTFWIHFSISNIFSSKTSQNSKIHKWRVLDCFWAKCLMISKNIFRRYLTSTGKWMRVGPVSLNFAEILTRGMQITCWISGTTIWIAPLGVIRISSA